MINKTMKMRLLFSALSKFLCGMALVFLLVFLPVGTFRYINGWLFAAVLFIPMLLAGIILFVRSPGLLEKRMRTRESQGIQKTVVLLSGIMFVSGFVLSGICVRVDFFVLPFTVSLIFAFVFLLGYTLYAAVLMQNEYLSRTVEVMEGQKVVDSGLYGIVRHPMYLSTVIMFMSIPLILGSLIGFFVFMVYPFVIGTRIKNEEELLKRELDGYTDYIKKVRYRLIPFIW